MTQRGESTRTVKDVMILTDEASLELSEKLCLNFFYLSCMWPNSFHLKLLIHNYMHKSFISSVLY